MPAALIKALAENGNRSLTVTTSSADNAATTIRIGNTGVAANMPQLAACCAPQPRRRRMRACVRAEQTIRCSN